MSRERFDAARRSGDDIGREARETLAQQPGLVASAARHFGELVRKHSASDSMLLNLAVARAEAGPIEVEPAPEVPTDAIECVARFGGFCWTCRGPTRPGSTILWVKHEGKSYVAHPMCKFPSSLFRSAKRKES